MEHLGDTRGKIAYVQTIVGIAGFIFSLWTYFLHVQLSLGDGTPLICDINEIVNCSRIIGSSSGELLQIPLGIYGMIYWAIVISAAIYSHFFRIAPYNISFWRLVIGSIGLITAFSLMYISYFILKGICEFCSIVQILCILLFIVTLLEYLRVRKRSSLKKIELKRSFVIVVAITKMAILTLYFFVDKSVHNYYSKASRENIKEAAESTITIPYSPILDSEDIDFSKGAENAPITLVEFTDFECPYCQMLHERLKSLQSYIDRGELRIVFRNWPLSYHKYARNLAIASRCAGAQGKFWEFADWSFMNASLYTDNQIIKEKLFSKPGILLRAKDLGLDRVTFENCLIDKNIAEKINRDATAAQELGGGGTPFIIINSKEYRGRWLKLGELENYLDGILKSKREKQQ